MSLPSNEEWRPVEGYEGVYEVSNCGRLRRILKQGGHRYLRGSVVPDGYTMVNLYRDAIRAAAWMHRLVLTAFDRPRQPGEVTRHLDGDPSNNRIENLRWGTQSENGRDTVRHGRHPWRSRTHCQRGHLLAESGQVHRPHSGPRVGGDRIICRACRIYTGLLPKTCPDCGSLVEQRSLSRHRREKCAGGGGRQVERRNCPHCDLTIRYDGIRRHIREQHPDVMSAATTTEATP